MHDNTRLNDEFIIKTTTWRKVNDGWLREYEKAIIIARQMINPKSK